MDQAITYTNPRTRRPLTCLFGTNLIVDHSLEPLVGKLNLPSFRDIPTLESYKKSRNLTYNPYLPSTIKITRIMQRPLSAIATRANHNI